MTAKAPKRPRDTNKLAKSVVDAATGGNAAAGGDDAVKNVAAVELGRLGGLRGGRARADSLTSERRSEIAKKAAKKRWSKSDG